MNSQKTENMGDGIEIAMEYADDILMPQLDNSVPKGNFYLLSLGAPLSSFITLKILLAISGLVLGCPAIFFLYASRFFCTQCLLYAIH